MNVNLFVYLFLFVPVPIIFKVISYIEKKNKYSYIELFFIFYSSLSIYYYLIGTKRQRVKKVIKSINKAVPFSVPIIFFIRDKD